MVLLVVLLLLAAPTAEALVLDVPSGKVKCLTEELRKGALSYAHYRLLTATSRHGPPAISARLTDPNGHALHHAEAVESGRFSFEAATAGRHTACFWSPKFEVGASLSVEVEWRVGIRSRAGAKAEQTITLLEEKAAALKQLEDAISLIHDEMIFLRHREMETQRLSQDTASRITSLTLCSLALCLAVASLQLCHLNSFFHTKNIF